MNAPATTATRDAQARRHGFDLRVGRLRGLATAIVVFAILLVVVDLISAGPLNYFDISFLSSGGATLALAAVGETIVILSGGFDLSAGAVLSLVNVVLATSMDPMNFEASILLWTAVGIGVGMLVGAFNGFFIAFLRLQPIVVTLSTMFIIQGVTLLILDKPGGFVSPSIGGFYLGDFPGALVPPETLDSLGIAPNLVPMPILLLVVVGFFWLWLKRTRFGTAIYAVGSDSNAAASAGLRVDWTRFAVYVVAGGFYGLGGVFISAQTGSGDPLVGNPLLLSIFAAVVVGGTRLGGGRGGPVGSIFGAYILMIVVNILLVLNVSAYYSTVAEGLILLLAVLAGSISRGSELARQIRGGWTRFGAWRAGSLPSQIGGGDRRLAMTDVARPESRTAALPSFWTRHGETLRFALPAYLVLVLVVIVTQVWLGNAVLNWTYWNSIIVLSSFLAILALGQGTVILTGGLDLSVPWTIGFCGILLAGMVQGSDAALVYALPVVLIVAVRDRPGQWSRHRLARPLADRRDAGHQRHAAGRGAGLFQRHAGRLLLAAAALVHDRQGPRHHAGRLFHGRFRHLLGDLPVANLLRAACLWHWQWIARRPALRHRGRPHAGRRLCAVGGLRGAGRHPAHRLLRPGEPRHGRRISSAVDRGRRRRRRVDHRWPRPLSRHAGRRPAAHRASDLAGRYDAALCDAGDHLRCGCARRGHRAAGSTGVELI